MGVLEVFILGLALSADAFSVTISNCFAYQEESLRRRLLMPVVFGAFQGLMPLAGYYLSGVAGAFIERYAGIITLIILGAIGGNMVREGIEAMLAVRREGCPVPVRGARLTVARLLFQGVATAVDAFAVGVSLRAQAADLVLAIPTIGITTAACCAIALFIGRRLGSLLGDRAEIVGGCVLIAIGIKALVG